MRYECRFFSFKEVSFITTERNLFSWGKKNTLESHFSEAKNSNWEEEKITLVIEH